MEDRQDDRLNRKVTVNTIVIVLLVALALALFAAFGDRPDRLL